VKRRCGAFSTVRHRFLRRTLVTVAATVTAFGEAEAKRSGCVDWAPHVVEPLRPPPPSSKGRVVEVAGVRQVGGRAIHWAGARG
jgi:hypothetical protein